VKHPIQNVMIAAAVSGLLAGVTAAHAQTTSSSGPVSVNAGIPALAGSTFAKTQKHSCKGKNNCKGQGGCKSSDNGCKGKNSCKGKGGCATDGSPMPQ
jgi:hypothetical protein